MILSNDSTAFGLDLDNVQQIEELSYRPVCLSQVFEAGIASLKVGSGDCTCRPSESLVCVEATCQHMMSRLCLICLQAKTVGEDMADLEGQVDGAFITLLP